MGGTTTGKCKRLLIRQSYAQPIQMKQQKILLLRQLKIQVRLNIMNFYIAHYLNYHLRKRMIKGKL